MGICRKIDIPDMSAKRELSVMSRRFRGGI
jgi:hypothetical protein